MAARLNQMSSFVITSGRQLLVTRYLQISHVPSFVPCLLLLACSKHNKLSIYTSKMAVPLGPDFNYPIKSGPSSWFNPTVKRRAASVAAKMTKHSHILGGHEQDLPDPSPSLEPQWPTEERQSNAHHLWRSRDNRKGKRRPIP